LIPGLLLSLLGRYYLSKSGGGISDKPPAATQRLRVMRLWLI